MNFDSIAAIFASIVVLATVAVVVMNPNSASVIRSIGDTFAGSIRAAQGRG